MGLGLCCHVVGRPLAFHCETAGSQGLRGAAGCVDPNSDGPGGPTLHSHMPPLLPAAGGRLLTALVPCRGRDPPGGPEFVVQQATARLHHAGLPGGTEEPR